MAYSLKKGKNMMKGREQGRHVQRKAYWTYEQREAYWTKRMQTLLRLLPSTAPVAVQLRCGNSPSGSETQNGGVAQV